ncbi:MAG: hypothetical protein LBH19_06315 [Dysgonamonadaceae bacterium]|jgi:outer membrane protein OmpA-like peptidoglycan-associated protein|nr:hypothetical protein [Dysgonamonadaceae bacterium]
MKIPSIRTQRTQEPVIFLIVLFFTILLLLLPALVHGQEVGNIRIANVSGAVSDDSLRVRFSLNVHNLKVGSQESLTLLPRLTDGRVTATLPAIIYSGSLRRKYDERTRLFAPNSLPSIYHLYTGVRQENEYRLEYESAIPYSSRLQAAGKLIVEYRYDDCCQSYLFKEDSYALDMSASKNAGLPGFAGIRDTVYVYPREESPSYGSYASYASYPPYESDPSAPARRSRKEVLYLEYPINGYHILPDYKTNRAELSRLNVLLNGYRGRLQVTAYASPEGPYAKNDELARNRAADFRYYLLNQYGISPAKISVTHVAEDWAGLRARVADSYLPGKAEILRIIDTVDVFSGREKLLMDLQGGNAWQQLKPYFPKLRRIEVEIID